MQLPVCIDAMFLHATHCKRYMVLYLTDCRRTWWRITLTGPWT